MQIVATCSAETESALRALMTALAPFVPEASDMATALDAARLTGAIVDDASLAQAVLLLESGALARLETGADQDPAAQQALQGIGAAALQAARGLSRVGDYAARAAGTAQAEALRKMLLAMVSDPRLVVARIAIQLARMRAARGAVAAERSRLATQTREVFAPLANRLGIWQLKWELEDLAFRYLEPIPYREIAAALAERREDRERFIVEFCALLVGRLQAAGIAADISGRPKHIFSIHRKMQRKQLDFAQIYDVRAVRILCASVADCYAALGIVHGAFPYVPGEFDDYIATPKDNFYRSIHTAVIGPQGHAVEVQIRTHEMHAQAELGVAAHWRYKEGGAGPTSYDRKIEWVRRLLEPGDADADGDFVERVRSELFEDRVYALTPRGEVIDLPRGATPLDFAYQVHTSLGHRCRGAKVNGRIVPLTHALQNGAVVEIIAGKQEAPSRDWLVQEEGFLASPRSRAKLRAWFRRQDAGENENAGRAILERELARLGTGPALVSALIDELDTHDAAQLCRRLGEGDIGVTQLVQAIVRRLPALREAGGGSGAPGTAGASGVSRPPRATRQRAGDGSGAKGRGAGGSPVDIEGVGDLPITLARCCAPVRPQPITGYVTLGRGVTVHAAGCASLRRMQSLHPARVLRVSWREDAAALFPVRLVVDAYDRRGLVRDLSEVVAAQGFGIDALQTTTDRSEGTARTTISLQVPDLARLAGVLRALARVPNVIAANRS